MPITIDVRDGQVLIVGEDVRGSSWNALVGRMTSSIFNVCPNATNVLAAPWNAFIAEDVREGAIEFLASYPEVATTPAFEERMDELSHRIADMRADAGTRRVDASNIQAHLRSRGFVRELKPFQITNLSRMLCLQRVADFSVPGGGKTTEALAFFAMKRRSEDRLLVVLPKNAFMPWEEEVAACIPGTRVARLVGGQNGVRHALALDPHIALITYQLLINVYRDIIIPHLASRPHHVYLDESHKIKSGADARTGEAVLAVGAVAADHRLILSGTPMPQSWADMVPQFQFLYPELCPRDPEQAVRVVQREFRKFYVRTTKKQLRLPERKLIRRAVSLNPAQRVLYDAITQDAVRQAKGLRWEDRKAFRRLSRSVFQLIQACTNPRLLRGSAIADHPIFADALAEGVPVKIQACEGLARELVAEGRKVVIWSIFVPEIELLTDRMQDVGARCIHGGVHSSTDDDDDASRDAAIRHFNDPSDPCRILIANPAACSEAISLHHVCHDAIYLDRSFNAAHWMQSMDRIHRVGLDPVQMTRFYIIEARRTIDQRIQARLDAKVDAMGQALDDDSLQPFILPTDADDEDDEMSGTGMSDDDLRALIEDLVAA